MRINQTNKLRMVQATVETIYHHQPEWAGISGYAGAVLTLENRIESIINRSRAQSIRTGQSAAKTEAFQTLTTTAFTVCSGLKACSSDARNVQLADQVNCSRTTLARGREADVVNRCQNILELGIANKEILASKFNVTPSDLDALTNAIQSFTELQPKPRQGRAASAAATRDLVTLFADVDKVLNAQIDPLMEKFRASAPAFYNEYKTARSIVDSAATREGKEAADTNIPSVPSVLIPKAA